jgi:hypothetical protein
METTRPLAIGIGIVVALSGPHLSAQSPNSTMSREVVSATGCVQLASGDGQGEGLGTALVLKGVRIAPSVGLIEAPRAAPATAPSSQQAQAAQAESGSASPTAATRESGADIAPKDSGLLLVADRGVDLATHVGHRVLVTGRLSSFAAAGGVASASSGRTLTVTSVSLIASACTTGS